MIEPTRSTTILTLVPSVITLLRETSLYSRFTTPVLTKCPQCVLTARELQGRKENDGYDLLIKVACFAKEVNNSFRIKRS